MFAGLLASARELRFPLTIGYSVLLTVWLLFGEPLEALAQRDPLGRRLLAAMDSLGSPVELGIITFGAAMIGSVLWHAVVNRLVRIIAARAGHPNWQELIDEAWEAARQYEEYKVVTTKGQTGDRPSSWDSTHNVPSPAWSGHLVERVQERERRAAEMSFRVTLAIGLVPIVVALGVEGGGLWWLGLVAVPLVWLDVALLKHTTLRLVNRYKLEDLEERLRGREQWRVRLEAQSIGESMDPAENARIREDLEAANSQVTELRAAIERIHAHDNRWSTKIFAFIEGEILR